MDFTASASFSPARGLSLTARSGMADVARLLEELRTVLWHRGDDRRARRPALGSPLRRLDGERRVVAPGNRLFYWRTDARVHVLAVFRVAQHLQVLGVARDDAGEREQTYRDRHQQADHQAEDIEEVGILLAHDRIRFFAHPADSGAKYSGCRRG